MAEKRESNEGMLYECVKCERREVILANNPRTDGRSCSHCGGALMFSYFVGIDLSGRKDNSALTITLKADVSDALTGLKAVTREAKKATAALKDVDDITSKKVLVIKPKPGIKLTDEAKQKILREAKKSLELGVMVLSHDFVCEEVNVSTNIKGEFDASLEDNCVVISDSTI
ncbi:hypothetical protein [Bacillus sp. B-jedd]|uniref:hypothetical protein n=1 Tax=Bacillus sp. B-jedd TaxID=1476857 RepID=UPI00051554E5|nr:hypothetical protein [Bacillus sp. B-jedd]CEG28092.1 hypothetical protein BN1002_02971 [Bacillus sp. B-jedd]